MTHWMSFQHIELSHFLQGGKVSRVSSKIWMRKQNTRLLSVGRIHFWGSMEAQWETLSPHNKVTGLSPGCLSLHVLPVLASLSLLSLLSCAMI